MKKRRVNLKELIKEDKKGYFRSRGYSTIKHTYIDEKGNQKEELLEFEIQPLGSHPLIKEYMNAHPEPKPPVIRDLIHPDTGKTPAEDKATIQEAKSGGYKWSNVYDYTDETYRKNREDYYKQIRLLQMMIVFGLIEEFGLDKVSEFEQKLEDLGFTANQINKIGEDIKSLDFFTENNE